MSSYVSRERSSTGYPAITVRLQVFMKAPTSSFPLYCDVKSCHKLRTITLSEHCLISITETEAILLGNRLVPVKS